MITYTLLTDICWGCRQNTSPHSFLPSIQLTFAGKEITHTTTYWTPLTDIWLTWQECATFFCLTYLRGENDHTFCAIHSSQRYLAGTWQEYCVTYIFVLLTHIREKLVIHPAHTVHSSQMYFVFFWIIYNNTSYTYSTIFANIYMYIYFWIIHNNTSYTYCTLLANIYIYIYIYLDYI